MNKNDDWTTLAIPLESSELRSSCRAYATFSPSRGTSRTIQDGEYDPWRSFYGTVVTAGNRWRAWLDYCKRRCFEDCIREIGGQRSLRSLRKMRNEAATL